MHVSLYVCVSALRLGLAEATSSRPCTPSFSYKPSEIEGENFSAKALSVFQLLCQLIALTNYQGRKGRGGGEGTVRLMPNHIHEGEERGLLAILVYFGIEHRVLSGATIDSCLKRLSMWW